jgi:hypothetical protein
MRCQRLFRSTEARLSIKEQSIDWSDTHTHTDTHTVKHSPRMSSPLNSPPALSYLHTPRPTITAHLYPYIQELLLVFIFPKSSSSTSSVSCFYGNGCISNCTTVSNHEIPLKSYTGVSDLLMCSVLHWGSDRLKKHSNAFRSSESPGAEEEATVICHLPCARLHLRGM